ncbi:hypothetical protein N7U66_18800 [Lacinutrix neustonica]|uniref:Uncharacterized protein n=1 Tax=Lacinutrix neustonica TaxID=2980107 RepID=A0A9E8MUS8_9FLAO|nr:hypothetical protein [Lacinutrix neustonica]WAC01883.1 hypothetical protein N7U66_18800 [Lacinutrix neustonica]
MNDLIIAILPVLLVIFILFILGIVILGKFRLFKEKRPLKIVTSIILSIFIYFLISTVYLSFLTKQPEVEFNEKIWIEKPEERYKMIDDLLDSDYLRGKQKNNIKDVFGEPKIKKEENWTYELIGRTWGDFKVFELNLQFENNIVNHFSFKEK